MSREILFRGKTEKGKWIEGFYTMLDEDGDGQWIEHYILTGNSDKFYGSGTCRETFEKAEVLPGTVGQFTGLLDKNGTRIFQGDVVKRIFVYEHLQEVEQVWEVYWGQRCWMKRKYNGIGFSFDSIEARDSEVIGNIHDNPELLEITIKTRACAGFEREK